MSFTEGGISNGPRERSRSNLAQSADHNIRYWSEGGEERASVEVRRGWVNFRCLAEKCPTPCCGPFAGLGEKLAPCFISSFSYLYLLEEDLDRIIKGGRGDLLQHTPEGVRLQLKPNTSCAAFENGLCTIHDIRPAVCRAFPFDLDVFGGLVLIAKCPGANAGWSAPEEFEEAVDALGRVYRRWIAFACERVRVAVANADEECPFPTELHRARI